MILDVTQSIQWLVQKLYIASRELEANGVVNPTFVLLTKGADDRSKVQNIVVDYFHSKFGTTRTSEHMRCECIGANQSTFHFPQLRCRVMLMDI